MLWTSKVESNIAASSTDSVPLMFVNNPEAARLVAPATSNVESKSATPNRVSDPSRVVLFPICVVPETKS